MALKLSFASSNMEYSKGLSILYLIGDRGLDLTKGEGYKIHVLKIIDGLKKKGHKVFLLNVNENPSLPEFENYLCIPHAYMPAIHQFFPYTELIDSKNILTEIIRLNRQMHFDVIHERYGLYSYGWIFAAKLLKKPLLLEVNAPLVEENNSLLSR